MTNAAPLAPLALIALLAPAALAQKPTGPSIAWDRFTADHGQQSFTAVWNAATGTPKAIFGDGLRVALRVDGIAQARVLSEQVLQTHADLLGRGRSTFVESIGQQTQRLYVFVYDQRYLGLEVIGGRADVRLNENGVVAMFGSKAVQIPDDFAVEPVVSMERAWVIAHDHLGIAPKALELAQQRLVELVIHAEVDADAPTTPRLAWRVQVDDRSGGNIVVGKVFVDARTGEVIHFEDEVYRCGFGHLHVKGETLTDGEHPEGEGAKDSTEHGAGMVAITGNVRAWMNRGDPLTPRTNEPLQGVRVSSSVGSAFTDANGDFTIPYTGSNPVTLSVTLGSGSGQYVGGGISPLQGSPVSTSVVATPGVPAQLQLLSANPTEFDWSQPTTFWHIDDVHRWVRSLTGPFPTNQINIANISATVNRASTCNAFYTNNTVNFYATGGNCNMTAYNSVVYHEWGHGIDHAFGGISQTDGLSEGWGDILSIYRLDDPIVGRNFTTSGGYVRTALNTYTFPAGGGVHQQGQTWMGFAWDVRTRLIGSLGLAAGIARAEAIVIASLVANATNQPDAVREVFLLDDDDGNLNNGTPNCGDLLAAAQARNLPTPITRCQGAAGWSVYGRGCGPAGNNSLPTTFYEVFGQFDLANSAIRFTPNGASGWTVAPCSNCFVTGYSNNLRLGDDQLARNQALGFAFPLAGGGTTSAIDVDSNGWIGLVTGAHAGTDYTESVTEFLSAPARIAAFWDDLNPASAGAVYFDRLSGSAVVTWAGVPEFPSTGSNTLQIQLFPSGEFILAYQAVSSGDGLVGYSAGGIGVDPGGSDISNPSGGTAVSISASARPRLNTSIDLIVSNLPPSTVSALMTLGFAQRSIDLTSFGMDSCFLLTSVDDAFGIPISGSAARATLPIPGDPALIDLPVYAQGVVVAPGVNSRSVLTSDGGWLILGN
ncbi:MAG: PepSY domain-containing protein [Planctomycetes bacterium]|nr:PepSY domain-containing protein [Planctomycetota bacterium]